MRLNCVIIQSVLQLKYVRMIDVAQMGYFQGLGQLRTRYLRDRDVTCSVPH